MPLLTRRYRLQGDWKLSWGKVGNPHYIADVDYDHARCLPLLPPHRTERDGDGAAQGHPPPPWQHTRNTRSTTDGNGLASADQPDRAEAKPPSLCPTKDKPCLFNVRASQPFQGSTPEAR